ncbi:hypothetical protein [Ideonella sp. BN130291]|uniref:hypothetical protein n=1 Tax=Ideonella sp. BN130291 TaxID=3112940 RepID=UPI002E26D488|nr:hypothetical protein [Ideonella sp. BN130291]
MNPTQAIDHTLLLQWLFGAVVVGLYARDRFDSPLAARCTTTFTRYWVARLGYIGSMLAIFLVLGGAVTDLDLKPLWQLLDLDAVAKDSAALPGPLLSALVLTSLLPHFPYLSKIDDSVKLWFQRVGNIPFEVRELSGQMRNAEFRPSPDTLARLRARLEELGIDERLLEAPRGSFRLRWGQAAVLFASVQAWSGSRGYLRYVDSQHARLAELSARFESLASLLDRRTLNELDHSGESSLADPFRRKLRRDIDEVHQAVCDFASGGVLHTEWGPRGRYAALATLGFVGLERPRHALGSHELVLVGGLIFFAMMFGTLIARRFVDPEPLNNGLRVTVMVTLIYVIAIVLAIYPKAVWPFADIRAAGRRPVAAYAVSGVAAAGAALVVSLLFRFVLDEPGNLLHMLSTPGRFSNAWFTTLQRWPWLLMTLFATIAIAWAADDHLLASTPVPRWLRHAEAAGMATVFALLQWMVVELMVSGASQAQHDEWMRRLPQMVLTSVTIGLCIGFLVPHLYRSKSGPVPAAPSVAPALQAAG